MPSMELILDPNKLGHDVAEKIVHDVDVAWTGIHELLEDAIMEIRPSAILHGPDAKPAVLKIEASAGTPIGEIVAIANAFLPVIDVEARHPDRGTMVWHEARGREKFKTSDWDVAANPR